MFPHDLARDALEADLRWRDPDGYRRVFRGDSRPRQRLVCGRRGATSNSGRSPTPSTCSAAFPASSSPVDWDAWGQQYPEPARPGDREAILDLVLAWEGEASAAIAARWWERQPEGFFVVRGQDGVVGGFLALLDLTRASGRGHRGRPRAPGRPGTTPSRQAPPRPTETVTQTRFVIDRQAYQGPSPTLNATPILTMQRYLGTPNLAWDFLTLAEPERWDAYFAAADLPARGRRRLLGRRPPLRAVRPRLPTGPGGRPAGAGDRARPGPGPHAVPADERSRRCWCSPSRSSTSRSDRRCVTCTGPTCWPATRCCGPAWCATAPGRGSRARRCWRRWCARRWRPCASTLATTSCGGPSTRTYVRPAATQERAAAALGLPFSTYRRHLTQGVDRVVAWLWDQEVYGGSRAPLSSN